MDAKDKRIREAIRRFFGTVDEALHAADEARRARKELERLTGKADHKEGASCRK